MWRCEDVQMWRCEDVDVQMWRCRWCSCADVFLRSTLRRRSREKCSTHLISTTSFLVRLKLNSAEPSLLAAGQGRAQFGDDHLDTLSSINNLGMLLETQGKLVEAEPLLRECLQKCPALRASAWPQKDQFMLTFCKLKIHYPRGKPWFDGWFGGIGKKCMLWTCWVFTEVPCWVFSGKWWLWHRILWSIESGQCKNTSAQNVTNVFSRIKLERLLNILDFVVPFPVGGVIFSKSLVWSCLGCVRASHYRNNVRGLLRWLVGFLNCISYVLRIC